jgi:3-(3-hydroxy-phenyl)propionate hydroxylase
MPMPVERKVIIAGGGPVGLIAGLMLGRAGVDVTLFDTGDILYQHPRAATIHPATLDMLDDLGVYRRIEPLGIVCPIVNYYDQQELLASFDHGILAGESRHPWVLQCEQDKLSACCSRWRATCRCSASAPTLRWSIAHRQPTGSRWR